MTADLFNEVKDQINWIGGTLGVDDSVEDKPYRDPSKSAFVDYFWSGKHKRSIKGVNLITLYYTDTTGHSYPVNFRIYDKREGRTKNDYFRKREPVWLLQVLIQLKSVLMEASPALDQPGKLSALQFIPLLLLQVQS